MRQVIIFSRNMNWRQLEDVATANGSYTAPANACSAALTILKPVLMLDADNA